MVKENTLWEKLLKPLSGFLVNEQELQHLRNAIHWEQEIECLSKPEIVYPPYYNNQNLQGIAEGYLTVEAAITYDAVVRYLLLPNETWLRTEAIDIIGGQPRNILDLGCGTGSTTLILKQRFPDAQVMGIDLSPYMLAMAKYKAATAGLNILWQQGNAQKTGFPSASLDVVTASLLFHEIPPTIAQWILKECFRLLVPGGQVIIFDGNQNILKTPGLMEIFEKPFIEAYAMESVDTWMEDAGFEGIQTKDVWMTHQVTRGIKPLTVTDKNQETVEQREIFDAIPAF
ncbi:class I SAM-dependent methyltransferase [Gloeothece verrucosa]|uniref:Methyltransferase type 11 n=1 Tax=Gloeothece verrucosa (strain PCC 7822) TaxID=497965 RepID=E0U9P3_GLOV7|nr:class I SAM-dependent methyltransferase [Gloeothece verrucosa]ADN13844.1 Methyltransferase type 11 [Gloeothece verrucosa PCC 7822]